MISKLNLPVFPGGLSYLGELCQNTSNFTVIPKPTHRRARENKLCHHLPPSLIPHLCKSLSNFIQISDHCESTSNETDSVLSVRDRKMSKTQLCGVEWRVRGPREEPGTNHRVPERTSVPSDCECWCHSTSIVTFIMPQLFAICAFWHLPGCPSLSKLTL